MTDDMMRALFADSEKLRHLTGENHGPFCPSCLRPNIVFFCIGDDESICRECLQDKLEKGRAK